MIKSLSFGILGKYFQFSNLFLMNKQDCNFSCELGIYDLELELWPSQYEGRNVTYNIFIELFQSNNLIRMLKHNLECSMNPKNKQTFHSCLMLTPVGTRGHFFGLPPIQPLKV